MLSTKGGEHIKQVLVRVSDDVHAKLKLKTLQENTSIQDILEQFISDYINKDEEVSNDWGFSDAEISVEFEYDGKKQEMSIEEMAVEIMKLKTKVNELQLDIRKKK